MKNTLAFPVYAHPSLITMFSYFRACQFPLLPPLRGRGELIAFLLQTPREGGVAEQGPRPTSPAPSHAPTPISPAVTQNTLASMARHCLGRQEKRTINTESLRVLIKLGGNGDGSN